MVRSLRNIQRRNFSSIKNDNYINKSSLLGGGARADVHFQNFLDILAPDLNLILTGEFVLGIIGLFIWIAKPIYLYFSDKEMININTTFKNERENKIFQIINLIYIIIQCIILYRMILRNNDGKTEKILTQKRAMSVDVSDWTYLAIFVKAFIIVFLLGINFFEDELLKRLKIVAKLFLPGTINIMRKLMEIIRELIEVPKKTSAARTSAATPPANDGSTADDAPPVPPASS